MTLTILLLLSEDVVGGCHGAFVCTNVCVRSAFCGCVCLLLRTRAGGEEPTFVGACHMPQPAALPLGPNVGLLSTSVVLYVLLPAPVSPL